MTLPETLTKPSELPVPPEGPVVTVAVLVRDSFGKNSNAREGVRVFTRLMATVRKVVLIGIADRSTSRRFSSQCLERKFAEQLVVT